jgi:hypothetical protein
MINDWRRDDRAGIEGSRFAGGLLVQFSLLHLVSPLGIQQADQKPKSHFERQAVKTNR